MVRTLGRELYLWHLAGPARTARHRTGHDAGLDSARARLAGKLSERRRRLGRNVCYIRKSFSQRKRRKHCFTDVLGNHGYWFPRRVLPKIRHVPAKFPAPRARHLRELPSRCRPSAEFFPLRLTNCAIEIAVIPSRAA